jgi:hypothetical protein
MSMDCDSRNAECNYVGGACVWCGKPITIARQKTGAEMGFKPLNTSKPLTGIDELIYTIKQLQLERVRLVDALEALERAEADYRHAHDLHGDGSLEAGIAWKDLRQAGDKARKILGRMEISA